MQEMAQCPVILVADIDPRRIRRYIYGTLALPHKQERDRAKGVIINNRGDAWRATYSVSNTESFTGVPRGFWGDAGWMWI